MEQPGPSFVWLPSWIASRFASRTHCGHSHGFTPRFRAPLRLLPAWPRCTHTLSRCSRDRQAKCLRHFDCAVTAIGFEGQREPLCTFTIDVHGCPILVWP